MQLHVTPHRKKTLILLFETLLIIIIVISAGWILEKWIEAHDNELGLYFFSAVFQGNMALLAIVGVFAVFKIQLVEERYERLRDEFVKRFAIDFNLNVRFDDMRKWAMQNIDNLRALGVEEPDRQLERLSSQPNRNAIESMEKIRDHSIEIKRRMWKPLGLSAFIAIWSLIAISYFREIPFAIAGTIILQIVVLIYHVRFIRLSLARIPRTRILELG